MHSQIFVATQYSTFFEQLSFKSYLLFIFIVVPPTAF